jgi:hypothetical protein
VIMLRYVSLSVFVLLVLASCEKDASDKIKMVSKNEVLELIDTISFEIDSELMGKYEVWTISDDNYFVAYHHMLHKIDVFSLSNQKFSYSIKLDNQGSHGVVPIDKVVKIQDEFFAGSGSFYYIISLDGLVLDKKMFSELSMSKEGYYFSQKGPQLVNFNYFSMDLSQNSFFQPIYKHKEDGTIDYSSYFMSLIDYTTWESMHVKVNYPTSFLESYSKSIVLGQANMIRSGSSFIFNFPGSNEIFELDTLTKRLKTHIPKILNENEMKATVSDYGTDLFSQNYAQMLAPRYLPVKHDMKNNSYYRLHKNKAEGRGEYGIDMFSASFYLIKMTSGFNTLVQYELDGHFSPKFQVHDGYLYFTPANIDESALYTLKIFRIKG